MDSVQETMIWILIKSILYVYKLRMLESSITFLIKFKSGKKQKKNNNRQIQNPWYGRLFSTNFELWSNYKSFMCILLKCYRSLLLTSCIQVCKFLASRKKNLWCVRKNWYFKLKYFNLAGESPFTRVLDKTIDKSKFLMTWRRIYEKLLLSFMLLDYIVNINIKIIWEIERKEWKILFYIHENKPYKLPKTDPIAGPFIFHTISRSSRSQMFCKKGILKIFEKCTGRHLCLSIFFNKVMGMEIWERKKNYE